MSKTKSGKKFLAHTYNWDYTLIHRQKFTEKSKTVPNDAMTIAQILKRVDQGLPVTGAKVPIYEGDVFIPELQKMDLVDRQELYARAKKQIEEIQAYQKQVEQDKLVQAKQEADRKAQEEKEQRRKEFEEFKNNTKNP